ncbi:Mth938-like domain-containing protein [Piscinibacter sakaiensis]|uniref:Mth938-like domain-containing protein n=1 Tax=Piscinibacter sakaiensis TaxID=1547922 RepID=UPI003AADA452
MKLQADRIDGRNAIARHGPDGVIVNGTQYTHSVIVPWDGAVEDWPVREFSQLEADHFDRLLALQPQLVIFGSGARLRFPPPRLLAGLMAAGIGVETMDNAAACRTYNVLLAEERRVVAALLFE